MILPELLGRLYKLTTDSPSAAENLVGEQESLISGETARPTCWETALSKLTDEQRQVLNSFGIGNTKAFEAEIKTIQGLKDSCTKNLSPGMKKPIMTRARIHSILKKMEKYVIIGDIAIQQNPDIIALVWAGVRFCLQVCEYIFLLSPCILFA